MATKVKPRKIGGPNTITLNGEIYFHGHLNDREALHLLLVALRITEQTAVVEHNVYNYVSRIEVSCGIADGYCRECSESCDGGDGWDGLCGNCADRASRAQKKDFKG